MAEDLEIHGVGKVFANGAVALEDVSFRAPAGTFIVLLGPSGSGKTTLVRCLAGIERISTGSITIGGRLVADGRVHLPPERRGLSMVFQDYALWPHLSAQDNVGFALRRHGVGTTERRQRAADMLARVGLERLARRYPGELSGGEQQRVALARALVGDTGLVLCDEPLSNLDADLRDRMRVEISALVRDCGATALYITHDQAEAFALADQVGVLEHGRLVQMGAPEDVYANPVSPFVARFTGISGELAVRVRGPVRADGMVEVEPLSLAWSRPLLARVSDALRGDEASLLIRPAAVRLCEARGQGCHAVGTVADVAFRGRGYELAIDLHGGGRMGNVSALGRVARGEVVGLRFDEVGCVAFERVNGAGVSGAELPTVSSSPTPPPFPSPIVPATPMRA
ncbi:MAG TPA: ABC transporter ATP-binding protein [Acidimicrobiales bacterium]|nr:ABC transporter ATP-binding protein [Acidimicrobiales bacterium]